MIWRKRWGKGTKFPAGLPSSDTEDEIPTAYDSWGGIWLAPPRWFEHSTYHPYMQAKLAHWVKQSQQRPGESLAVWLLCLWDLGVDSIMCTDNEMEKLASIMTHLPYASSCKIASGTGGGRDLILC